MTRSKVPSDPTLSQEMRKFLDDISRQSVAEDLDVTSITADVGTFDELTIDGKNPFLQGGEADAGLDHNFVDHGTLSGGTLTIDPLEGFFHKMVNNGAITISPAASDLGRSCVLHITNSSGAGVLTFTGWTKPYSGSVITTVDGDRFAVFMYFYGSDGADYAVQARQT